MTTSAARDETPRRIAGTFLVRVERRVGRRSQVLFSDELTHGQHVVIGRQDERLLDDDAGGGEFVAWPQATAADGVSRRAVRIDLMFDRVQFTLASGFIGDRHRPPTIEAELNGRVLTTAELQRSTVSADPFAGSDATTTLLVERHSQDGRSETLWISVGVAHRMIDRSATQDPEQLRRASASAELRRRWWLRVEGSQIAHTFSVVAHLLAGTTTANVSDDDIRDAVRRVAPSREHPRSAERLVETAVRSLFVRGAMVDWPKWDACLRVVHVARLYSSDVVDEKTDGGRTYAVSGDLRRFAALTEQLMWVGVLPEVQPASFPPSTE